MQVCRIELIAIFRKSRRHQSVFVTSEYMSSTTTTTATIRHLLHTHNLTGAQKSAVNSRCLANASWQLLNGRGARLVEQPLHATLWLAVIK